MATATQRTSAAADPVEAGLIVGTQAESPADRQARQKLSRTVSLDFPEGASFEDVLSFLRETGDISIAVNWNALAIHGIDRTTDTLGLRVKDARLETVLDLVLENISPPMNLWDTPFLTGSSAVRRWTNWAATPWCGSTTSAT